MYSEPHNKGQVIDSGVHICTHSIRLSIAVSRFCFVGVTDIGVGPTASYPSLRPVELLVWRVLVSVMCSCLV